MYVLVCSIVVIHVRIHVFLMCSMYNSYACIQFLYVTHAFNSCYSGYTCIHVFMCAATTTTTATAATTTTTTTTRERSARRPVDEMHVFQKALLWPKPNYDIM